MAIIENLRKQYQEWKDRRFLRRHGCETWKQYHRQYDTDISPRSTRIKDFYCGYPYWYIFENREHQIYWWDMAYDGSADIITWCEDNCRDKFRFDCFRVIKYPSTAGQWEMNEIGGGDYYFAAFKDERDFLMFTLRWAS